MKRFLLILALLGGFIAPAFAQVNTVPQIGVITSIQKQLTYSAVARGLAPAASATDVACISAGATKTISIKRIEISGSAGTLVSAPFTLLRRASLDTAGTPATGAALPVGSGMLSSNPASNAVLTSYTANPTINDSSPTYVRSAWLTLPVTTAGVVIGPLVWDFATSMDFLTQGLDITKGSTTQICLNLNGVSVSSGILDVSFFWTEN